MFFILTYLYIHIHKYSYICSPQDTGRRRHITWKQYVMIFVWWITYDEITFVEISYDDLKHDEITYVIYNNESDAANETRLEDCMWWITCHELHMATHIWWKNHMWWITYDELHIVNCIWWIIYDESRMTSDEPNTTYNESDAAYDTRLEDGIWDTPRGRHMHQISWITYDEPHMMNHVWLVQQWIRRGIWDTPRSSCRHTHTCTRSLSLSLSLSLSHTHTHTLTLTHTHTHTHAHTNTHAHTHTDTHTHTHAHTHTHTHTRTHTTDAAYETRLEDGSYGEPDTREW